MSDRPLSFHWRLLDAALFDPLGSPAATSAGEQRTRAAILTEAYLVAQGDPERWVSYSRNKNWYSQARRYRGTAFAYVTVTPNG